MSTAQFFQEDFSASLFPLKTNHLMVTTGGELIRKHIYDRVLNSSKEQSAHCFLPQQRVYAAKPLSHLRRTVCLDPVATYYLYDLIYRNRNCFRKPVSEARMSFGYRFEEGKPVTVHAAFKDFRMHVNTCDFAYDHVIRFDIASYFNSLYHHDVCHWFEALPGISTSDAAGFGQFCREIGSGRSVDFLPQGIYPAKMIGNEFLKFIDLSKELQSGQVLRFMDDIYLFDDDEAVLTRDFVRIQELLGAKALNINPSKTARVTGEVSVADSVSEIRAELIDIIDSGDDLVFFGSGVEQPMETVKRQLDDQEIHRLLDLLIDVRSEESDVELILAVLQNHSDSIASSLGTLLARFPNIAKQLHKVCEGIDDKETVASEMLNVLKREVYLIEYQLFWMAAIAEDHLASTTVFGDLVLNIYNRAHNEPIARAKVLEIPDQSFGLKEIRDANLKSGAASWITWASAAGTRTLLKGERNYALDYFSKASPINFLVAECIKSL